MEDQQPCLNLMDAFYGLDINYENETGYRSHARLYTGNQLGLADDRQ